MEAVDGATARDVELGALAVELGLRDIAAVAQTVELRKAVTEHRGNE
jgi:hypothetical protein